MLNGETVPGRRASLVEATFIAPFPTQQMRDVMAELQASAMASLAWLVPGLGQAARNLREHGGVRVRLTVRVGPFFRRVEKRVVVYQMQGDWLAIG
jgi:enhancing lycopene biosynthesis protein 2